MLKILSKLTIAALALLTGVFTPMNRFVKVEASTGKYISEVKVGMDKTEAGAAKSLLDEGFTILKNDKGENADLNKDAGSKDTTMGRGQKVVYLGFKTTHDPSQAITD